MCKIFSEKKTQLFFSCFQGLIQIQIYSGFLAKLDQNKTNVSGFYFQVVGIVLQTCNLEKNILDMIKFQIVKKISILIV